MICADFSKHALHLLDLFWIGWIRSIDDMQQKICIYSLLQGRLKCIDQSVRQVTNESHSIRQRHRTLSLRQIQLPSGRI